MKTKQGNVRIILKFLKIFSLFILQISSIIGCKKLCMIDERYWKIGLFDERIK